ncbi:putative necrosis-inducing factor-domain-containing protein [Achaetomium macrosporum]|uniref:Necrosis-inducing factor-domain-containing protein n=1 Tax=Achaetomium macrosporum TaxID=79813 RepID=A0AAN7C074_9PEZI|nr:putative necrosis-inducing factor-domain-containing protein [Achaetomium macrosporum]
MQIFNLLAIAAFFAMIHCAPKNITSDQLSGHFQPPHGHIQPSNGVWYRNSSTDDTQGAKLTLDNVNVCGASSFENQASTGSPLAKGCLKLRRNLAGPGIWPVDVFSQHTLAKYGTCAFGVNANGGVDGKATVFKVGNEDIRDMIAHSIFIFRWEDAGLNKVGTRGFMPCQPDGLLIERVIYHA